MSFVDYTTLLSTCCITNAKVCVEGGQLTTLILYKSGSLTILIPKAHLTDTMGKGNNYAWYACMVVATTMILYGYDSSTFNAVQGSKNWVAYFHKPSPSVVGSINTAYNVGGIIAGE